MLDQLASPERAAAPPVAVAGPRPRGALIAGLMLVVVGLPLVLTPFTTAPFSDGKLVLLIAGTMLVAIGIRGRPFDPRLATPAGIFVVVELVAASAGVDPMRSLLGLEQGGDSVLILCCAATLLVTSSTFPEEVVARLPKWIVGVGLAIAAVELLYRTAPGVAAAAVPDVSMVGSTLGNPVFAAAMLSVALAVVVSRWKLKSLATIACLVAIASGLGTVGERSAYVVPLVAVTVALWRRRPGITRSLLVVGLVAGTLAAWIVIGRVLPASQTSVSPVVEFETPAAEQARFAVYSADAKGFLHRPFLGWGPGNTWSAYVSSASPREMATAGRGWADAHDLFLEVAVGSGVLGVAALVWLLLAALRRARGVPAERSWIVASAIALGLFQLGEPVNVVVTPTLFLLLGLWVMPRARSKEATRRRALRGASIACVGLMSAGLVLSTVAFAASTLEQWGRGYGELWADRASHAVAPWRMTAAENLAIRLAVDGRSADASARREALALSEGLVAAHPWDPTVRLSASDVARLLQRPGEAAAWEAAQLRRFPSDTRPEPQPSPTAAAS
jgi:O-antigen ligase